jgi:DNA-binding CsgD family transcriptional regulator
MLRYPNILSDGTGYSRPGRRRYSELMRADIRFALRPRTCAMSTQTVTTTCNPVGRHEVAVEDLIRALVHATSSLSEAGPERTTIAEEILIDLDVDGARYLVVRMPMAERPQIPLSPREQEVVRMVALGHPNKVIAEVLNISVWTVCTHLRRIFAKAGVGSRAAMVARLMDATNLGPHSGRHRSAMPAFRDGDAVS